MPSNQELFIIIFREQRQRDKLPDLVNMLLFCACYTTSSRIIISESITDVPKIKPLLDTHPYFHHVH